ncbi:DNA N-6-adenine-methyltransferase [Vibrio phage vB_VpM-pA2SJ1]|uniref:DNA N-6-adenine-methyltransferase n=1 Tax=Vibrio phage vB_VpM-pA2SJ1 TaxID=3095964 RepID=A0AAX4J5W4_9CAUD
MAILISSKTVEGAKNRWATSHEAFNDALALYGRKFSVDVCAEPQTAKVDRFYVSPEWLNSQPSLDIIKKHSDKKIVGFDALQCDWDHDWWCNPPFDLKKEFLEWAHIQAVAGRGGMMMIPYEPLTGWWRKYVTNRATAVFEPDGRYQFYEIDGVTKKQGANFGTVFVLFTPHAIPEAIRIPFKRGIGNAKI